MLKLIERRKPVRWPPCLRQRRRPLRWPCLLSISLELAGSNTLSLVMVDLGRRPVSERPDESARDCSTRSTGPGPAGPLSGFRSLGCIPPHTWPNATASRRTRCPKPRARSQAPAFDPALRPRPSASTRVEHRHQVHPGSLYPDIRDVHTPEVIWAGDREPSKEVRVHPVLGMGLADIGSGMDSLYPHLPHMPLHRLAVDQRPFPRKLAALDHRQPLRPGCARHQLSFSASPLAWPASLSPRTARVPPGRMHPVLRG